MAIRSRLVATLGGLALTCAASASEPYRAELDASYARSEGDDSDILIQQTGLTATWFPRAVAIGDGPWREAAFLDHASAVIGHVNRSTLETGVVDADGIGWGLGGRYADRDVPITVAAAAVFADLEDDDTGFGDVEIDTAYWSVEAGYYLQRGLLVGPRYVNSKITTSINGTDNADDRTDTFSLFGKWVGQVADGHWLNVDAEVGHQSLEQIDNETLDSWVGDLAVDWYPVPWFGVGPTVRLLSGEDDAHEGWTYGGRITAWATPNLGIHASLSEFMVRDSDAGEDSLDWSAGVIGRF
jgi:hypothetical protein